MPTDPPTPPDSDLITEDPAESASLDDALVDEEASDLRRTEDAHARALNKEELLGLQQTRKLRDRMFWLLVAWLSLIVLVVFLHGFSVCGFSLSPVPLTAVISSGTIPVVAILVSLLGHVSSSSERATGTPVGDVLLKISR